MISLAISREKGKVISKREKGKALATKGKRESLSPQKGKGKTQGITLEAHFH